MIASLLATTIVPALLPAAGDAIRGLVAKFTGGGDAPQNVDEKIKLMEAETKKLVALAKLDTPPDNISLWVANLRASCRYIVVLLIIANVALQMGIGASDTVLLLSLDMASSAFFFLFGDRVYLHLKKKD